MKKKLFFSSYIDVRGIKTNPINVSNLSSQYRYSLEIPFKDRGYGPTAVVILKNPSKAGLLDEESNNMLSDDTIYNVCDYLYKRKEKFSKVIVLNLFPIYSSTFKNIAIRNPNQLKGKRLKSAIEYNNKIFKTVFGSLIQEDKVILAWGGYPNLNSKKNKIPDKFKKRIKELYDQRINNVLDLLEDKQIYKVGNDLTNGKFPQHGKMWYDFEDLIEFSYSRT